MKKIAGFVWWRRATVGALVCCTKPRMQGDLGHSLWTSYVHRHAAEMMPGAFKAFRCGIQRRHNIADPREFNAVYCFVMHHSNMAVRIAQFPFIAMQLAAFFLSFPFLFFSFLLFLHCFPLPSPSLVSFLVCIELAHPIKQMTLKTCADAGGGGIGPMRVDLGLRLTAAWGRNDTLGGNPPILGPRHGHIRMPRRSPRAKGRTRKSLAR